MTTVFKSYESLEKISVVEDYKTYDYSSNILLPLFAHSLEVTVQLNKAFPYNMIYPCTVPYKDLFDINAALAYENSLTIKNDFSGFSYSTQLQDSIYQGGVSNGHRETAAVNDPTTKYAVDVCMPHTYYDSGANQTYKTRVYENLFKYTVFKLRRLADVYRWDFYVSGLHIPHPLTSATVKVNKPIITGDFSASGSNAQANGVNGIVCGVRVIQSYAPLC